MPETAVHGIPEITQADVSQPANLAFKLNMLLRMLGDNVSRLLGRAGPCRMGDGPYQFTGKTTFDKPMTLMEGVTITGTSDRLGNLLVIRVDELSEYANDAAAKAGGLHAGDFYRTATGAVMVVVP